MLHNHVEKIMPLDHNTSQAHPAYNFISHFVTLFILSTDVKQHLPVQEMKMMVYFKHQNLKIQRRPLIIIADNVINQLLVSKSVVPKHPI
jgi:hypothetical protein